MTVVSTSAETVSAVPLGAAGVDVLSELGVLVPGAAVSSCMVKDGRAGWAVQVPWVSARAWRLACDGVGDRVTVTEMSGCLLSVDGGSFTVLASTQWPERDVSVAVARVLLVLDDAVRAGVRATLLPDVDVSAGSFEAVLTAPWFGEVPGSPREHVRQAALTLLRSRPFGEPLTDAGPVGVLAALLADRVAARTPAEVTRLTASEARALVKEVVNAPELVEVARGLARARPVSVAPATGAVVPGR